MYCCVVKAAKHLARYGWIVLTCHLVVAASLTGQSNQILDSLHTELRNATTDTAVINLENIIAFEFRNLNLDSTHHYAQRALAKSQQLQFDRGIARALNMQALAYGESGDEFTAKELNEEALVYARRSGYKRVICGILNDLAFYYTTIGDYEKAIELALEAISVYQEGRIYVYTLDNLSFYYLNTGDTLQAERYQNSAIQAALEMNDPLIQAFGWEMRAGKARQEGKWEAAVSYLNRANEIYRTHNSIAEVALTLAGLGRLYETIDPEKSIAYYLDAIALEKQVGRDRSLVMLYHDLAKSYYNSAQYDDAERYAERGHALAQDQQDRVAQQHYLMLFSKLAEQKGDHLAALQFYRQGIELQESILSIEQKQLIADMTARYELKEKEAENLALQAQQRANETSLQNRKIWILVGLIALIVVTLLAAFALWSNRQKQRYNQQLKKEVTAKTDALRTMVHRLKRSNEELERFNYITSHDLKEPIRNIVSFASLIERETSTLQNDKLKEYVAFVSSNARHLYQLVEDILEYARMDHEVDTELEPVELTKEVERIEMLLLHSEDDRSFRIEYGTLPTIVTHRTKVFIVLKNLIENGLKYNESSQPRVLITYEDTPEQHGLIIEDNGIGIAPEFHEQVFAMFKRLHNRSRYAGSGVGLAVSRKIARQLGGDIRIENLSQGTRFIFSFAKVTTGVAAVT